MTTRQDILMERAKRIGDDLESQGAILNYKSTAILFLALDSAYNETVGIWQTGEPPKNGDYILALFEDLDGEVNIVRWDGGWRAYYCRECGFSESSENKIKYWARIEFPKEIEERI